MTPDQTAAGVQAEPTPPQAANTPDGLWQVFALIELPVAIAAPDTSIVWCSDALADLASSSPEALIGRPFAEALGTERPERVSAVLTDVAASQRTLGRALIGATDWAGTVRRLAISAATTEVWNGTPHLMIVVENRTNDRRNLFAHDASIVGAVATAPSALTALPSRATFDSLFEAGLRRSQRNGIPLSALVCSLDGFDEISAHLGRGAADTLIAASAARLAHALRGEDLLVHEHGGRFVVIADAVANDETALQVARRLRTAVSEPIVLNSTEVRVGLSIGYAIGFERGAELISAAERGLAIACERGTNQTATASASTEAASATDAADIDWTELATGAPDPLEA